MVSDRIAPYPIPPPQPKDSYEERVCKHDFKLICRTNINNSITFAYHCLLCGKMDKAVKKASLSESEKQSALRMTSDEIGDIRTRYWEGRMSRTREEDDSAWWNWYNGYLRSHYWKARQQAVMKRTNGVCEGCEQNRASQVHHTTYKHVGREPLFDLRAVCADCHEMLHLGRPNGR